MKYIAVVNTINRPQHLVERCLNALLAQKISPIKVILMDQNENELELSKRIIDNPLFTRNKVNYKSVSAARNSVVIPEGTDWIFFCDDDGYACDDYSETLQNLINKFPDFEIFAGSIIREDTNEYYSLRHKKGGSLNKFRNTKNLMGSNFVIKASTFNGLERFDKNFGVGSYWGSSEETDLCWKAFFNKVPMEFFPQLKVYHIPPFNESINKGFIKAFKYGVGKGAMVYKWLIEKRKIIVLYEFGEMLIMPFFLSLLSIIKLKPQLIATNFAALAGRLTGFIKAMFIKRS
jgi:GT2 family glycosyltransferase